ncbi:MAG: glycogen debranching enzyme family protein [Phycisphaerales bacterium]|nr:MAG: glycogen debranching enzyme family protein [Phycisphaerales bacterium]
MIDSSNACELATCDALSGPIEALLEREWLLTNGLGGYAAGTVAGCPTRRYHGLLVAPKVPPLQRHVLLAATLDRVALGAAVYDCSTFEFPGTLHPTGYRGLINFEYDTGADEPWVRFTFRYRELSLAKRVSLLRGLNAVRIAYAAVGPIGKPIHLEVSPFLVIRDFHALQHQTPFDPWILEADANRFCCRVCGDSDVAVAMFPMTDDGQAEVTFEARPRWWYDFLYREDMKRGFAGGEDLYSTGTFRAQGVGSLRVELVAVGFAQSPEHARRLVSDVAVHRPAGSGEPVAKGDDATRAALHKAADAFVVRRVRTVQDTCCTILAGYPWFGDWGRDTFIALEGLLLATGRFAEAEQVLATFAGAQRKGLIPNRFDDYGGLCAYNSVDASLWYIHAADAYVRYTDDADAWKVFLADACYNVVDAFVAGTDFDIFVDERGLLHSGSPKTQITWMDAKVDDTPVTPRHGLAVEINALWYSALRLLADRAARSPSAGRQEQLAERIRRFERHFEDLFWNEEQRCMYDCVREDGPDPAVRPNQIFAVSLPYTALKPDSRRAVLEKVREELLTPYGLRTLSPKDPRYCAVYQGDVIARDKAYHNGTVWAWLIGPYIEAHLRVSGITSRAKREGRELLKSLIEHLSTEACLGNISEIFDGDWPHHPRGCFAQAWSVAEVLRAYELTKPG